MKLSGPNIRTARQAKSLTQRQLADMIGADVSTVKRAERGVLNPTASTVGSIAQALGVTVDSLYTRTMPA